MKCPVCGEHTISVQCSGDQQGEPPWTAWITVVDDVERECECVLTDVQEQWLSDNLVCDEPDGDDYWAELP